MPELPEVETSRRGIEPHLLNQIVQKLVVRNPSLRWPVSNQLAHWVEGHPVKAVKRRAKYLKIEFEHGDLIVHLGMSGSLRIVTSEQAAEKHDHVDLCLSNGKALRFTDPRRFGFWLWSEQPEVDMLLSNLGPEPLTEAFNSDYIFQSSRGRKTAIKNFIMDNKVVVGVGNIYAAESLFKAGIHPKRAAGKISANRYEALVSEIKSVLKQAIEQGGTTLKDFTHSDGKPGYFKQELMVYGREGETCFQCGTTLKGIRQGQRATVYCPDCQT